MWVGGWGDSRMMNGWMVEWINGRMMAGQQDGRTNGWAIGKMASKPRLTNNSSDIIIIHPFVSIYITLKQGLENIYEYTRNYW